MAPLRKRKMQMQERNNMLDFEQVVYQYPVEKSPIIDHLSFHVDRGEFVSIIGASDNDMSIVLNVQKQTIYHRRQIVRKHINSEIEDIDAWLRTYVLR